MAADVSNQPAITYLVHGEPDASGQLRDLMHERAGMECAGRAVQEKVTLMAFWNSRRMQISSLDWTEATRAGLGARQITLS